MPHHTHNPQAVALGGLHEFSEVGAAVPEFHRRIANASDLAHEVLERDLLGLHHGNDNTLLYWHTILLLQPIAVFKKFVDTCEHSKKAGPSTPFAAKSATNSAQDDKLLCVAFKRGFTYLTPVLLIHLALPSLWISFAAGVVFASLRAGS
jgi:hypothetical protein